MPLNLRLLQISDSALPISGYTHSWGLEAAIARGLVHDPETLERWTLHWLKTSLGPLEGVLCAESCRAALTQNIAGLARLNQIAEASILPPTIRRASREMGDQLLQLGQTWIWSGPGLIPILGTAEFATERWYHPVAFGLMGAVAGAPVEEVLSAFLHQGALGMVGAGVRAIPVGHTHGQQVLAYLHEGIMSLVHSLAERVPEMIGSGSPYYEVLCDEQTRLYARMFRS